MVDYYKDMLENVKRWTFEWFKQNAPGHKAIIGMSGGKDSTICAALLADVFDTKRVLGVIMPDEGQGLNDADKICDYIGIDYIVAPIGEITRSFRSMDNFSEQSVQNLAPRVRMTMLYYIAQSNNGIVVNTCNLSEDYIGYSTLYGDLAGSVSPLGKLTVTEIKALGYKLNLLREWIEKTPDDGLAFSQPDEQKLGFSYSELDEYIRKGYQVPDKNKMDKILLMHKKSQFKRDIIHIPAFDPQLPVFE